MNNIIKLFTNKIELPKSYHNFVDKRTIFGIPNGMDILSNLFIALPAFYLISKQKKISFLSFNILLLALTSTIYHINPTDNTIFMDMIFVVSLNTVVLSYFVDKQIGYFIYLLGILSVFYWKKNNDIRLYELLKIIIPIYVIIIIYKDYNNSNNNVSNYILLIIILSILIRYSEFHDKEIYQMTGKLISGHTLKHIIAGINIYIIIKVLEKLNKI